MLTSQPGRQAQISILSLHDVPVGQEGSAPDQTMQADLPICVEGMHDVAMQGNRKRMLCPSVCDTLVS